MGVEENGSSPSPADAAAAVTVTGARTVAPAKNRCTLATFDLPYITFYYNQKLLLYRTTAAPDFLPFPDAVARMTAALADALRVFYPLAGRIVVQREEDDDGGGGAGPGALAVEGDDGAEVFEAEALGVAVDDLAGGDCTDEAEKVMQQLVPYTGVMNLEGLRRPLLAVQVSACACHPLYVFPRSLIRNIFCVIPCVRHIISVNVTPFVRDRNVQICSLIHA